eukprot:7831001-Pyramimonas_sp.AAC.1
MSAAVWTTRAPRRSRLGAFTHRPRGAGARAAFWPLSRSPAAAAGWPRCGARSTRAAPEREGHSRAKQR